MPCGKRTFIRIRAKDVGRKGHPSTRRRMKKK